MSKKASSAASARTHTTTTLSCPPPVKPTTSHQPQQPERAAKESLAERMAHPGQDEPDKRGDERHAQRAPLRPRPPRLTDRPPRSTRDRTEEAPSRDGIRRPGLWSGQRHQSSILRYVGDGALALAPLSARLLQYVEMTTVKDAGEQGLDTC